MNIIHRELSYLINGVLFAVHNQTGRFASEKQIGDLIEVEFKKQNIPYQREYVIPSPFEGELPGRHRADFLIDNKIVLELKYRHFLTKQDYAQVQRYLKVLNLALGILVNFRDIRLHPKRILNGGGKE